MNVGVHLCVDPCICDCKCVLSSKVDMRYHGVVIAGGWCELPIYVFGSEQWLSSKAIFPKHKHVLK